MNREAETSREIVVRARYFFGRNMYGAFLVVDPHGDVGLDSRSLGFAVHIIPGLMAVRHSVCFPAADVY